MQNAWQITSVYGSVRARPHALYITPHSLQIKTDELYNNIDGEEQLNGSRGHFADGVFSVTPAGWDAGN